MTTISRHTIERHRRLCIQKDINDANSWMFSIECFNTEIEHLSFIEKQLLRDSAVSSTILAIRRKNVLLMANLCKYEQELKVEFEYGDHDYDLNRYKIHEQKRASYLKLVEECNDFKNRFYRLISRYQRK